MIMDGFALKPPVVELVQKMSGWLVTIDGENELFFYSKWKAQQHKEALEIQFAHQAGVHHGP